MSVTPSAENLIRLPTRMEQIAARVAERIGVSLEQFIVMAIREIVQGPKGNLFDFSLSASSLILVLSQDEGAFKAWNYRGRGRVSKQPLFYQRK